MHDYEKKLLKRSGGPHREKPIKLSEIEDTSKLSSTDLVFARWAERYLYGGASGDRILDKSERDDALRQHVVRKQAEHKTKPAPKSDDVAKAAMAKLKAMGMKKGSMMTKLIAARAGGVAVAAAASADAAGGKTGSMIAGKAVTTGIARPFLAQFPQSQQDTDKKKPSVTSASRGLFARVLAKHVGSVKKDELMKAPMPVVKAQEGPAQSGTQKRSVKVKKLAAAGGLLARVQKRAQGRSDSPDAVSTPPAKRVRKDDDQNSDIEASAVKTEAPATETSSSVQSMSKTAETSCAATSVALPEQTASEAAPPPDPTCHHFHYMANMFTANGELEEGSKVVGQLLRALSRTASAPQAMLKAALSLLDPVAVVQDSIIAEAVDKAYNLPSVLCLEGEVLASKALEGHALIQRPTETMPPLTIKDVDDAARGAHGVTEEERKTAAESLSGLFVSAQSGKEAFCLVRALQGKLVPDREVMQGAMVVALL